jgi:hypothetical protein
MLVMHKRLARRTVRQARSARETPEASIAGCFLLQSRTILIEEKGPDFSFSVPAVPEPSTWALQEL